MTWAGLISPGALCSKEALPNLALREAMLPLPIILSARAAPAALQVVSAVNPATATVALIAALHGLPINATNFPPNLFYEVYCNVTN